MKSPPDPHGQAALMLVESLLILLVEKGVVKKEQVVDAIDGVIEVQQEIAGTSGDVVVSIVPIGLLQTVARSLSAANAPERPAGM